ncbi:uncharacterized protein LOC126380275 [Pectinophora gossypiella]|uniref:uncharacterized protein LOC126380275 n=1 Tax=Pectinophora gossypiella TaxID=13191 RepID=UPI00214E15F5|nr:uncharacterized protein LOC126380275 [Pectinophora gossypiella]
MPKDNDSLFLLEVLIDKIILSKSPCFSDKDFRTCVNVSCPSVDPLEICDDDPAACVGKSGGPFVKTFNSGKSCLFSLSEGDISAAMSKFPIQVTVFKSLPCGCLPTKILMGDATIDMTKEFVQARNKYLEDPTAVSFQALKDSFRLVGQDGAETGEIIMFLRISCFGKLIVTRFQGTGAMVTLGAGAITSINDRSCNPPREMQSIDDPCVCGLGHGTRGGGGSGPPCTAGGRRGGFGVCPPDQDPYNSMPCEEPDDPCYCTGPKPQIKPPLACRNTDPYCLHVPKGALPRLPYYQELTKQQVKKLSVQQKPQTGYQDQGLVREYIRMFMEDLPDSSTCSLTSLSTLRSKRRSVSFSDTVDYVLGHRVEAINDCDKKENFFGKETTVYMTLWDVAESLRSWGTQATASINKCIQVPTASATPETNSCWSASNASCTRSGSQYRNQDVFFFEKFRGMGNQDAAKQKQGQPKPPAIKSSAGSNKTPWKPPRTVQMNTEVQSSKSTKSSACTLTTCPGRSVCIVPPPPCPNGPVRGDLMATVSHIKIGPREPCPVHGNNPCQGPGCVLAASQQDNAAVKVSQCTNPRRGVFELVIRRMTGAPLAKNELMLEWTPPPCRSSPCGPCAPYTVACYPSVCPPSRCRLVMCRPAPSKPKCCRKACQRPCGVMPCGPIPCRIRCRKCCRPACSGNPCRYPPPCGRPCPPRYCSPPSRCRPCGPVPCGPSPCCADKPCKSMPCLKPCPVGYRRPRRIRSYPKIRPHRKAISPCLNRSRDCPVARCRSLPGCSNCFPCPPRRCRSVGPCRTRCCKSVCC